MNTATAAKPASTASFSVKGFSASGTGTGAQIAKQIAQAFGATPGTVGVVPTKTKKGKTKKARPKVTCDRCGILVSRAHLSIHHKGSVCALNWTPSRTALPDIRELVLALPSSLHEDTFARVAADSEFAGALRMIWESTKGAGASVRERKVSVFVEGKAGRAQRITREKGDKRERAARSEYKSAVRARDKAEQLVKELAKRVRYYDRKAANALTEDDKIADAIERYEIKKEVEADVDQG